MTNVSEPAITVVGDDDAALARQHLLEMAHAIVRDSRGRILVWNKGMAQMYGWSAEEALGQQVDQLLKTVFPVPRVQIEQELENRSQWEGELIHTRKDGATIVVASHWVMHRDPRGQTTVLEINNDVTELKRLQEALRESDRRKDEFLATLAHELRNPLAPIRNALHLLRLMKNNPATLEQTREMMERQVKHMVRLIDDLLELSRLSRGKIQIKRELVELRDIVNLAVDGSRPWIDAAGHDFSVDVPDEPIWLEVDPVRLTQVLLNLLNNAAKYTEPGGKIWLTIAPPCAGDVVFTIRDTGVGIPQELLPQIFDMFTQVDRSLDRTQGGLGIGLSLVRGLVQLHGGRVEATSAGLGQGSEFIVRLPLSQTRRAAGRPAGSEPPPEAAAPLRILVVDDNRDAAQTLTLLLQTHGHEVHQAYDGVTALEAAQRLRPQAILCDIGLPRLNGYEVARRLRSRPGFEQVLLLALTGWGQEEDRRRSQEAGFDAHLVKPVEQEALLDMLTAVGTGP